MSFSQTPAVPLADAKLSRALVDPGLRWLAAALDGEVIARKVCPAVAIGLGRSDPPRALSARLIRYKPGRRCMVYYEFDYGRPFGVYGKIRARSADLRTQALLEALERAGLNRARGSKVSVPRPVGVVPDLHLTLQLACPGRLVSRALNGESGVWVMESAAEGLAALHRVNIESKRSHTIEDEMAILTTRLQRAAALAPKWGERIRRVSHACRRIAGQLETSASLGIHRDFYPDQVLVDDRGVTLLDLDLFAKGDPALDVGNFTGHLTELSLRNFGRPDRWSALEAAFEARYLELAPDVRRESIRTYRILTLARHLHLSMTIDGRAAVTGALLDYCEEELALVDQKFARTRKESR